LTKNVFFTMNTSYSTRSNGYKTYKKYNRTALQRFTFSQRIINNWNSLPHEIVTSPNVLSFKIFLYSQHFSFICMIYWDWFYKTVVVFFFWPITHNTNSNTTTTTTTLTTTTNTTTITTTTTATTIIIATITTTANQQPLNCIYSSIVWVNLYA